MGADKRAVAAKANAHQLNKVRAFSEFHVLGAE